MERITRAENAAQPLSLQPMLARLRGGLSGGGVTRMKLQNLRVVTRASLLPGAAIVLAAGIFVADTIADLEIAFPAFYTVVVLLAVRFCKKRGVILVVAITLAAGIFIADTIANLEIAFPAFYTVVVLLAVRFCKKRGVIL